MNRFTLLGLLALVMTACDPIPAIYNTNDSDSDGYGDTEDPTDPTDQDGDGISADDDCDDNDASVGVGHLWYLDSDSDGYGDDASTMVSCEQPEGYVSEGGDCMDNAASVHPGANEICDGVDQDCNGEVDDSQTNIWYLDYDGDSYGDSAYKYTDGCDGSSYLVDNGEDCDDTNAEVNPGATEVCDGLDNDCEGSIDEDAEDAEIWYVDADGDSFGDASSSAMSCEQPVGYTKDDTDCNDHDPAMNPDEVEVCDELDNDCDGIADEEVQDTFYVDSDNDGYGDPSTSLGACSAPSGYVSDATDCDDADSSANPGATEICDGVDNDCDGTTDEDDASDASTWYDDVDGDGYGDPDSLSVSCEAPSGSVDNATDCDDTDASVNPGVSEVCNDVDDDCDGVTDPSTSADAGTWYLDADSDSYGDASSFFVSCDAPSGYVADATDCDDGDASSYPGAIEYCDGADNDCDGFTDPDSSADATTWYEDDDGDGYGDPDSLSVSCEAPSGSVDDATDCDDADSSVNPGATEYCDEQDNDCDGQTDEGVQSTFYADTDGDGYGDVTMSTQACLEGSGYVSDATDCDDTNADTYPGADEYCDGADNDCDGDIDPDSSLDASTWYADSDEDGFGDSGSTAASCDQPSGYVVDDTDCDDTDASSYPDAPESCDGADNDCDGTIDENLSSQWYVDADGDLYGAGDPVDVICLGSSASLVDNADDCDDDDASVNPDATEVCDDGADNDCVDGDEECVGDTGDTGGSDTGT